MKTTHIVALELFLVLLLAGCANLPVDQACRAAIEKESKVLAAMGHTLRYHRTPSFPFLLSAAEDREQIGDYQSCLNVLQMAHVGHNPWYIGSSGNYFPTQSTYRGSNVQNQSYQNYNVGGGGSIPGQSGIDAAHHAAGHTHHHGH